jgi:hypothetical protein
MPRAKGDLPCVVLGTRAIGSSALEYPLRRRRTRRDRVCGRTCPVSQSGISVCQSNVAGGYMAVILQSNHILPTSFAEERVEMCTKLLCLAPCRLECTKLTVAVTVIFIDLVGCHQVKGGIVKLYIHRQTHKLYAMRYNIVEWHMIRTKNYSCVRQKEL